MKYRVEGVAFFEDEDDAKGAMDDMDKWLLKAVNVNCGSVDVEISYSERERCFHDEDPSKPCIVDERHEVECPPS